jgi:outer membrane receptor for Fe3+-dicitrate
MNECAEYVARQANVQKVRVYDEIKIFHILLLSNVSRIRKYRITIIIEAKYILYNTADVRLCIEPKDGKVPFVDRNMNMKGMHEIHVMHTVDFCESPR